MKPAAFYFTIVFGTGFLLGPIRILLLVPRVGTRTAELLEMPLMLVAIVLAARFINRRHPSAPHIRTGFVALTLLLAAEVLLGITLTGATPLQVLLNRDPVSGTAYYAALAAFAAMPWWLSKQSLTPK